MAVGIICPTAVNVGCGSGCGSGTQSGGPRTGEAAAVSPISDRARSLLAACAVRDDCSTSPSTASCLVRTRASTFARAGALQYGRFRIRSSRHTAIDTPRVRVVRRAPDVHVCDLVEAMS